MRMKTRCSTERLIARPEQMTSSEFRDIGSAASWIPQYGNILLESDWGPASIRLNYQLIEKKFKKRTQFFRQNRSRRFSSRNPSPNALNSRRPSPMYRQIKQAATETLHNRLTFYSDLYYCSRRAPEQALNAKRYITNRTVRDGFGCPYFFMNEMLHNLF